MKKKKGGEKVKDLLMKWKPLNAETFQKGFSSVLKKKKEVTK